MVKLLQQRIIFLFCLLFITACGAPAPASVAPTPIPPVSDEELLAAIKQAHSTLNTIRQAMLAPKPSYSYLGLKVRFKTPDGGTDDDWTEPIDYYDGIFTIKMLDGLTLNYHLHPDDTLNVPLRNVVDWMIVEKDGNLIGGYTIRLVYDHLTPEEQVEFIKNTGYKIK